jgi:heme/copper-type cytochrome/quinol oxidase subunit 2
LSPVVSQVLFWCACAVLAVAQLAVLRAALAGRTPPPSSRTGARALELFWIVLPAVALIVVLSWTWRSLPGRRATAIAPAGQVGTSTSSHAAGRA